MLLSISFILLAVLVLILSAYLCFLRKEIKSAGEQMAEIEQHPESNRQLKSSIADRQLEGLFKKINVLYQARQQDRILYRQRETQIRQEIENISHDLRTPLTSILGYLELIRDEDTKEEEREEYLNIIGRRARILQSFIQDFYEISRIEADDYPFALDQIPVQEALKEAVLAYYNDFNKKALRVEVDLEEKLCRIIADPTQFNRILNNLLQNALKYAKHQFILKQFSKDGYCCIQFINDNDGIPPEELPHLFDRFYTGDQSRTGQSSGLGLTITKTLTEKMNGQIEASLSERNYVIEIKFMVSA